MDPDTYLRAISYPYYIPARCYVVTGDRFDDMPGDLDPDDVSDRQPILALGSNQSPEQLIRKFNGCGLGPIPVQRAELRDFDIVYSPHVSAYGAIPATLRHSSGTRVRLFVNWLSSAQVVRMHETEVSTGNYHFGRLDGIRLTLATGRVLTSAFAYVGSRGTLARGGEPVALSAIGAEGRRWPALSQEQIQDHARERTSPGRSLEVFILEAVGDPEIRRRRTEALMAESLDFNYRAFTALQV